MRGAQQRRKTVQQLRAGGQLLQAYRVRDLMNVAWLLPPSVSSIHWTDDLVQFDDAARTYTIRTFHCERWVFDITISAVIDAWHPARWLGALVMSAIVFFAWAFAAWHVIHDNEPAGQTVPCSIYLATELASAFA
jgi:hypothetical protein